MYHREFLYLFYHKFTFHLLLMILYASWSSDNPLLDNYLQALGFCVFRFYALVDFLSGEGQYWTNTSENEQYSTLREEISSIKYLKLSCAEMEKRPVCICSQHLFYKI